MKAGNFQPFSFGEIHNFHVRLAILILDSRSFFPRAGPLY